MMSTDGIRSTITLQPLKYFIFKSSDGNYLIGHERLLNVLLKEEWVKEDGINVPKYTKKKNR